MVPNRYEKDKSLGIWVSTQRKHHINNKLRVDRKDILDKIGFAWKDDGALTFKPNDKLWHQQYEKLLEYKRKIGHCMVPNKYKDDKSLKVHLPIESDQGPALLKAEKLALGQTKEAMLQVVLLLQRKLGVVAMKKTQNRLW
jgi:hypothetical protein